jgi:hypothetical protein
MMNKLRSFVFGWIGISTLACTGLLCLGCGDTVVNVPNQPSAATPTPTPTPLASNLISFRVVGNASSVRVRYTTPADGLTQVFTTLPFVAAFSTTATSVFLSLEAQPLIFQNISFPFLSIQIVVNDTVFLQTSSQDTFTTLAVSGTWRR